MRRKSPVQQWVDSIPPQENKPIERTSSHDDISVTEEACDIASLKLDLDTDSTTTRRSTTPIPCHSRDTETKEDNAYGGIVDEPSSSVHKEANGSSSGHINKNGSSMNKNENGSCSNSESVTTPQSSDESEQKDRVYQYSKSVDSSGLLERDKAPLLRDRSVNSEGNSPKHKNPLHRDSSLQSDTSRASSVESLLEARKVDAEAVLRGVGFGPSLMKQQLARIPDRFLKPSQVKGVDTEQFIKEEQKSIKMHDCGVFGYKGLTGDPHAPTSTIVTKIIERISSREEIPEQQPQPLPPMARSRRNTNTY